MRPGGKIISIQFLRAIASLLVLQVHLFPYLSSINKFFCGSIGVDIFFVISGYIIAESVVRLPAIKPAATFLINRFSRVAPYYYLLTIVAAVLIFFFSGKFELVRFIKSLLFLPDRRFDPILYLGWSLIHEMFFYLFVALMIFAFPRTKILTIGICFFCFISLCSLMPSPPYILTFFGADINYTFLFGLFIFVFKDTVLPLFTNKWWLASACLLLIITAFLTTDFPSSPKHALLAPVNSYRRDYIYIYNSPAYLPRILAWGIPSAFLFISFYAQEGYFSKWKNSLMVLIGDASYSLYLIQGFLVLMLLKVNILNNNYIKPVLAVCTIYTALKMFRVEAAVGEYCKKYLKQKFIIAK
jgi:peptidoglycan/LPS O-acetylase OafA/YrhL